MTIDDLIPNPMSDIYTASMWSDPKNEHLLLSFINDVLLDTGMRPIVKAEVMNPFNIKDFAVSKQIVLDVRVRDERDWLYDIEVQTFDHTAFVNRALDYWADTYSSQLARGSHYTLLRPVISIILTSFPLFPRLKNPHTVFELRARENPDVIMTDHLQIHFLRIQKDQKRQLTELEGIRRGLCDWLNFFTFGGIKTETEMAALTHDNPIIQEAYAELQRFYANGETREKIKERERFLTDYELGINASKAEGEAKGKADAIVQLLTFRFAFAPQEIQAQLLALQDIGQLDRLMKVAYDCQTLDEFASHLR